MGKFRLVQRLEPTPEGFYDNPFGGDTNVGRVLDAHVRLDYMGAAEFEGGAIAKSANRIAQVAKQLKVVSQRIVVPVFDEDVHFVCTDEQEKSLLPEWYEWAQDPRSMEPTYYFERPEHWSRSDEAGPKYVGWWAIREDLIWTRELELAENIRQAFVRVSEAQPAQS